MNAVNKDGWNGLHHATFKGHVSVIDVLVSQGGDMNQRIESGWGKGRTPLMMALRCGKIEAAEQLIRLGADVNIEDSDGNTALSIASMKGLSKIVEVLKEHGAH